MQIIFESKEEKEKVAKLFTGVEGCPSDIGLRDSCEDTNGRCKECWIAALESIEKKEG